MWGQLMNQTGRGVHDNSLFSDNMTRFKAQLNKLKINSNMLQKNCINYILLN